MKRTPDVRSFKSADDAQLRRAYPLLVEAVECALQILEWRKIGAATQERLRAALKAAGRLPEESSKVPGAPADE